MLLHLESAKCLRSNRYGNPSRVESDKKLHSLRSGDNKGLKKHDGGSLSRSRSGAASEVAPYGANHGFEPSHFPRFTGSHDQCLIPGFDPAS